MPTTTFTRITTVITVCATLSATTVSCISQRANAEEASAGQFTAGVNDRMYYEFPAAIWEETLPLGNGRLGMMPDGGVQTDHIVLNEISMWSGNEADYRNPDAAKSLPEIRRLLSEGKNAEAQEVMYEHFATKKETADARHGCYETLANLDLKFSYCAGATPGEIPDATDYTRDLSLADAVAHTGFTCGNTRYTREYFTSRDNDVFIIRLTTSGNDKLNFTAPGEHPSWGATNTGGAWLCAHLWDHYLYTGDDDFLRRIYPVMKGAADFFLSTMVVEPKHGWLVTSPSSSPENQFLCDGKPVSICMGPTMDVQILTELFRNTSKAAALLGTDKAFADSLDEAVSHFPPMQIGSDGRLMEWLEEYPETEPHHRHVSHLYGLHPSNLISPHKTPELAEACRKSLIIRGDEGTGWSRAWKICFWARLCDGDHAWKLFHNLLSPAVSYDRLDSLHKTGAALDESLPQHSGTFPNLFCSHDPFQIDGNFGGASGIAEMLLQNHEGYVNFIPALPSGWHSGSVRGMRVRGFATVDFSWENHTLQQAVVHADRGHGDIRLTVKTPDGLIARDIYGNEFPSDSNGFIYPTLSPGSSLKIRFT